MKCVSDSLRSFHSRPRLPFGPRLLWLRVGSFWVHVRPDTKGVPPSTPHPAVHRVPALHGGTGVAWGLGEMRGRRWVAGFFLQQAWSLALC